MILDGFSVHSSAEGLVVPGFSHDFKWIFCIVLCRMHSSCIVFADDCGRDFSYTLLQNALFFTYFAPRFPSDFLD